MASKQSKQSSASPSLSNEANTAIEEAITGRKRLMLVAMATGTGKTFTLVNEVYRLMKSGVGQRILFLVDRRALAAQAVRAFASFEPEPGLKFDKIYEVYSQRFQREDFDEAEKFDPKVLPSSYQEPMHRTRIPRRDTLDVIHAMLPHGCTL
jgi:type I restriction enzyme, R subunit